MPRIRDVCELNGSDRTKRTRPCMWATSLYPARKQGQAGTGASVSGRGAHLLVRRVRCLIPWQLSPMP